MDWLDDILGESNPIEGDFFDSTYEREETIRRLAYDRYDVLRVRLTHSVVVSFVREVREGCSIDRFYDICSTLKEHRVSPPPNPYGMTEGQLAKYIRQIAGL